MDKNIIDSFQINEKVDRIQPIGSGHINDTYTVNLIGQANPTYILQRINHNIFPNIEKLSDNIHGATTHLELYGNGQYQVMKLIATKEEKLWHQSVDGNYWRLFTHIPDSRSCSKQRFRSWGRESLWVVY